MIKLKEILTHFYQDEKKEGLIPIDNWRATHSIYLEDMGFRNDGIYHYALKKPDLKLCYKRGIGFILEDRSKLKKRPSEKGEEFEETKPIVYSFRKFKQLEEYFANYKQKWESAPYEDQ